MKPRYMSPGFDQDDTKGLPLFDLSATGGFIDEPKPAVVGEAVHEEFLPTREVIVASPLTVEQADALRRGETISPLAMLRRHEEAEEASASIRGEDYAREEFNGVVVRAVSKALDIQVRLIDPKVRGTAEEPRLSAQCQKILAKLKEGPATNKELAAISLKYTGRISDLRQSGYQVDVISRDRKTGVTIYKLMEKS